MLGLVWNQVRRRAARSATLLTGIVVVASSFTVLTGAVDTSQVRTVGTVQQNFRAAYDILVRPHGSTTGLERSEGLVRANYLSGIFGGITLDQYHAITKLPGVEVAAPIAMIGYVLPFWNIPIDLTDSLGPDTRQVLRVDQTWTAQNGLSRFPDAPSFSYVTRYPFAQNTEQGDLEEAPDVPPRTSVCTPFGAALPPPTGPFDPNGRTFMNCWSLAEDTSYTQGLRDQLGLPPGHVGTAVTWAFPFLLAAIDPVQEAALVHLDQTVVSGRYLQPTDQVQVRQTSGFGHPTVPVLAATEPFVDDRLTVTVTRITDTSPRSLLQAVTTGDPPQRLSHMPGTVVATRQFGPNEAYEGLLKQPLELNNYWTGGPTSYTRLGERRLAPVQVHNDPTVIWRDAFSGYFPAPLANKDTSFRALHEHVGSSRIQAGTVLAPFAQVVGRFDASKLPGFDALTRVPLETYNPPEASGADARSRQLLGNRPLVPDENIAGYLQAPPLLLTTLASLPIFADPHVFTDVGGDAPISVIRIRVGGLQGPVRQQLARITQVASSIHEVTGLDIDITAGSSPTDMTVELPPGTFGRPALSLEEGWVHKGVAVQILTATDRKSLTLFSLLFIVCALFVGNGAAASVRARRRELGVLACLGWRPREMFRLVLGELVLLGLVGGALGVGLAWPIARAAGVHPSPLLAGLVVPAAVIVAVLAGLVPGLRAARAAPADAVRPAVTARHRVPSVRHVGSMAVTNLLRAPGRSLAAVIALAVGVAALTLLLGITQVFRGAVVGSLLGNVIAVQVRGVDYAAVVITTLLGAASVADVLYLGLRERAGELATLTATGWRPRTLTRLILTEAVTIGLVGSAVGAAIGLAAATTLGASPGQLAVTTAVALVTGVVATMLASLLPGRAVRHLPTTVVLAEE